MCSCYGCVKYTLFVINLIIVINACAITGYGAYVYIVLKNIDLSLNNALNLNFAAKDAYITNVINNKQIIEGIHVDGADILGFDLNFQLNHIGILITGIGSIIFSISFCGCCGSICRNQCLLILYTFMMFSLAAAQTYLYIMLYNLDYWVINILELLTNFVGSTRVALLIFIGCELVAAAMAIYLLCATEKKMVPEQPDVVINYNTGRK